MVTRLILLAVLIIAVLYVLRRILPPLARDPRWRLLLSGMGLLVLRQLLRRQGPVLLARLLAALRLFRF